MGGSDKRNIVLFDCFFFLSLFFTVCLLFFFCLTNPPWVGGFRIYTQFYEAM